MQEQLSSDVQDEVFFSSSTKKLVVPVGDAEKSRENLPSHCLQLSGEGRRAGVE